MTDCKGVIWTVQHLPTNISKFDQAYSDNQGSAVQNSLTRVTGTCISSLRNYK